MDKHDIVKLTGGYGRPVWARCPYSKRFIDVARKHGGVWRPLVHAWKFPIDTDVDELKLEMEVIYGKVDFNGGSKKG
jgi:hypothetical protein